MTGAERLKDIKNNAQLYRTCWILCYKCQSKYPHNESAYYYKQIVHKDDTYAYHHPILNQVIPVTYCTHCGYNLARISKVERLELKYQDANREKKTMTKEQKERYENDLNRYASINGSESLRLDFLQPFWPDGTPNKEFAEVYKEQRSNTYTTKQLWDMGFLGEIGREEE